MKFILLFISILLINSTIAQEISYSISVPNSSRMGALKLPDSIDTSHYYSHDEIRKMAEPVIGWSAFYDTLSTLEYPQQAKIKKLQSRMSIGFRVNELGVLDSVYIKNVQIGGKWSKCLVCEEFILDFFRNLEWKAGSLLEKSVKTVDYRVIEFTIYDPKAKKGSNPFGY